MEINVEMNDYVNVSEKQSDRKQTTAPPRSGRKLSRLVVLTLGLLCVLQGSLNISLHLTLYHNLTEERDQLQASNNNLTKERDQLQNEMERLNERSRKQTCLQGWRKFVGSCYYVSTESKTWEESRQDCLSIGADLVVINSRDEQIFINQYGFDSDVWIGLTDREGTWTWVDGTPLTTTYWESGQPNNNGGVDQDCVEFLQDGPNQIGEWNDEKCSERNKWICEK